MLKKAIVLMVVFGCVFLLVNTSAAQDKKMYVGITASIAFENLDTDQTQEKFSGPLEIDFDDAWGIQGRLGYVFNELFTLEAMGEYIFPFEAEGTQGSDDLEARNIFLNGKLTCPAWDQFKPYAVLGIGIMNAHEDIEWAGQTSETSDWGAGFRGAVGFDYYFTETVSAGLEAAYSLGTGDVDHLKYTTISLGAAYHF